MCVLGGGGAPVPLLSLPTWEPKGAVPSPSSQERVNAAVGKSEWPVWRCGLRILLSGGPGGGELVMIRNQKSEVGCGLEASVLSLLCTQGFLALSAGLVVGIWPFRQ